MNAVVQSAAGGGSGSASSSARSSRNSARAAAGGRDPAEPRLSDMLRQLDRERLDLILVEGVKQVPFPKIDEENAKKPSKKDTCCSVCASVYLFF